MAQRHSRSQGSSRIGIVVTGLLVIALIAPVTAATAKDSGGGKTVLPTPGSVVDSGTCLGGSSPILHPPGGPDIAWPFGPGITAATNLTLDIVAPAGGGNRFARFTLVDASVGLPEGGEERGPDALSFNLPSGIVIDEDNIRVISPSTFKRFRVDSTPGGDAPFGEFDWQVRRDEHDATPFVFEVAVMGVDLSLSSFETNAAGFQLISRTNGIPFGGQDENRAFSACLVEEEASG